MTSVARRPWWEILLAMLILHAMVAAFTGVITEYVRVDWGRKEGFMEFASTLGRSGTQDIASILGIAAAIQVAVLLVLIGGQIVAPNERSEAGLRSSLFLLAAVPLLATTPAMTLGIIASNNDPDVAGRMYSVAPQYLVQMGICVFIGTFQSGRLAFQLKMAKKNYRRSIFLTEALEASPHFSSHPVLKIAWTTGIYTAACAAPTAIGLQVTYGRHLLTEPHLSVAIPTLTSYASVLSSLLLFLSLGVFLALCANISLKPAQDKVGTFFVWLMLLFVEGFLVILTIEAWVNLTPLSIGLAGSALTLLYVGVMSTLEGARASRAISALENEGAHVMSAAPKKYAWWQCGDFFVAGTSWSLLSARHTKKRSLKRIEDLDKKIEEERREDAELSR